jgi:hypothetical protein
MTRKSALTERLVRTVRLLGDLCDDFIFVGGSVVQILVTDEAAPEGRTTVDIDVIVEALTYSHYHNIEKRLAMAGFQPSLLEHVISRFINADITLDVMPTNRDILGVGGRWYEQATKNPIIWTLPNERTIRVINAPLFLCTKFDAYDSVGTTNVKDLEDIIAVIDGRSTLLNEIEASPVEVIKYVSEATRNILDAEIASKIDWFLPVDGSGAARAPIVLDRLEAIAKLSNLKSSL